MIIVSLSMSMSLSMSINCLPNELLLKIITYLPNDRSEFKNKFSLNSLFILAKTSKLFCIRIKEYCNYLVHNHRQNLHINDIFTILKILNFVDCKDIIMLHESGANKQVLMHFSFNNLKNYINNYIDKMCYDDDDITVNYNTIQSIFCFGWGMRFIFDPADEEIYEKMYIYGIKSDEILEFEKIFMKRKDFMKKSHLFSNVLKI